MQAKPLLQNLKTLWLFLSKPGPHWQHYLISGLVALLPILLSLVLINGRMGTDFTHFVPTGYDEVMNWHQVTTFREAGFQGGYYSLYERPAPAGIFHFYTYGPQYPILYGLISRVTGWVYYSAPIINSLLIAVALFSFSAWVLKEPRQILVLGLLVLTFWPGIYFLFSNMQESMHQAIAVLMAAIFYVVISRRGRLSTRLNLLFIVCLSAAVVTRLSWMVLLPPYFAFTALPRRRILTTLRCFLLCGILFIVTLLIGAPGDNSVTSVLGTLTLGARKGAFFPVLEAIWAYTYSNIRAYLNFGKAALDVLQTLEIMALIVGSAVVSVRAYRSRRTKALEDTTLAEANFHLFNLGAIIFASILLYIVGTGGDYRVISAHLLVSLLVLLALRRFVPVVIMIVISLLFLPPFLADYTAYMTDHLADKQIDLAAYERQAQQVLHYDASAPNAWCNTLLFTKDQFDDRLTALPGGIGLSNLFNELEPNVPFRSRYLLMSEATYQRFSGRPDAPPLELLASLSADSNLYLNKNAACDVTS